MMMIMMIYGLLCTKHRDTKYIMMHFEVNY